ncbi:MULTISPECIES: Ig-like domain-containing protein [unclassified Pseudomonas]|uniref:Ig-like domain-containing protein n=1 Tax=unclassified Pseudomonas TaxID=196821 RepID=UPI000D333094|nr:MULTISPECIES: Ig-like domain-containing protein [unclassified Pseudomonas]RAU49283.1 hypothetical protein DBP26_000245 [Pseudomonas sp. RIT 409]RAU55976.1 hypothetical protein DBY65_002270 [Pseudomonas sp. RIT 412]
MPDTTLPDDLKQFLLVNPLKSFRPATRLSVWLDDQLCMRKALTRKELDAGFEIILNPDRQGMSTFGLSTLALIDLEIPGATGPLDDGSWGINVAAAQTNFPLQGLQLYLQPWSSMAVGDSYKILLDGTTQVASGVILKPEEVGARVIAFVPSNRLTDGAHKLSYSITRIGQAPETSDALDILIKLTLPGGVDEDGSVPGHSALKFDLPDEIINDGVDAAAAKAGIPATIHPYPNMAAGDDIKLSWGGYFVHHAPVTQNEVGKDIEIVVDEATILAAGDSDFDGLAVTFEVYDLVLNRSTDWAAEMRIVVDTGNSRLDAPFVAEANNGELDLDVLGTEPATLQVTVRRPDFAVGDKLVGKVTGTTVDGDAVQYESDEVEVLTLNHVYEIPIPNAILRRLAKVQAAFSYRRLRAGVSTPSRGQFVNVKGSAVGMTAPIAKDAAQGALDPDLAKTAIEIPWDDSMAASDQITLRWIGTRADFTVYDPALPPHTITGREETNKLPITISVDGTHLKTLDGGTLQLYFELAKDLNGTIVVRESARATLLNVGEPRAELPNPVVAGVNDGVMDPDLPGTTLTVPVYPNMEIGDEVHSLWKGSKTDELEDWIKINSFTKDKAVVFDIDEAFIKDNDEGTVAASYWVIRKSGRRSDSEILNFQVGAGAVPLLPVAKVAGSEDGVLDLAEIPNGARVVIPAWTPDMNVGDHVYMTWEDDEGTPPFRLDKSITGAGKDKDVQFTVPLADVTENVDATVSVSYRVVPLVGEDRQSLPLMFDVEQDLPVQLPEPVIVEAIGNLLDPNNALSGARVRIPAEAQLKAGDSVTLTWQGQPGDGSVKPTQPVTAEGELLIPIAYSTVKANDGFSVILSYTVKRADQSAEGPSPSRTYDIKSAIVAGLLNVMGARFHRCMYRASATPRRISAFDKSTGAALNAEWQYEGDTGWTQAKSWRDSRPWTPLHIRTSEDHVLLSAVNIIGNGNDTSTSGDAAQVAHRDSGDVIGWGNAAYGGTIPPTIITMDDIVEVCCSRSAYTARRKNGYVVAWGAATEGGSLGTHPLDSYVALTSNSVAIAGIRTDGKVYAWGVAAYGGTVPDAIKAHSDITQVIGAGTAFAAVRGTGQVVAWGAPAAGGTVPGDVATFTDIKEVSGNFVAFAALRANRRVVAWGTASGGGTVTTEVAAATVAELGAASANAFSLITTSGQVLTWGNAQQGGTVPADIKSLTDIVEVSATWHAMAARRANGHVVAWGTAASGGTVPTDIATLNDIVQVVGNSRAFAALRRNGTVVAWGDASVGGNTSSVVAQLINVKAVYANSQSFVALRSDGEIVTWGYAAGGGDSSAAQPYLKGRVSYETRLAVSTQALKAQAVTPKKSRVSRTVSFSFAEWAKPQVPDALGDVLDPGDDPEKMIKVHIPPGTLKYQDRVSLYLEDTLFDWTVVNRSGPGTGIDFEVPASEFMVGAGGQLRVWYGVIPAGETAEQPSADLLLTISGGFEDDVTLDLTAHNYLVAEGKAPAQPPAFARFSRAADWGTGPYTYASSEESVASVDDTGTVTALANGTCSITARDSLGATQHYALTIAGMIVVHFLTASTDWAGMQRVCATAGLDPASLNDLKALWTRYADSQPVSTYLGWLDYPLWTADPAGVGTYWTYDLSGTDPNQNASASDGSLAMQAVGISRTAGQRLRPDA